MCCLVTINNTWNTNRFWLQWSCWCDCCFFDIYKVLDNVLHDGFIFKLKWYDVEPGLLSLIKNYLPNREHRVVLNDQYLDGEKLILGFYKGRR